ncbi:hypothetical protein AAG747_27200 [Rapidithrix thailandica]|uniref:Polyketide cyclase/dehydrase n=1 Tax=Rapidithrix thailandica TaxID=413964 RepID=A0AAW9SE22_9BACT
MKFTQYSGIVLGALYGLIFRMLCNWETLSDKYDRPYSLYSITFIWILPIVVSIVPFLFAPKQLLNSKKKQIAFPMFSVLLFFLIALSSGLEDWLCLLILAFPFLISAGITGLTMGYFIKKSKSKKLFSLLFLPFLLNPFEARLPNQAKTYQVATEICIDASPQEVWKHLIEVPEIRKEEYKKGFYQYIGVPRPIKSELHHIEGQLYRIGYFTGGLKLYETISKSDSLNYVSFQIHIDKSELRDLPTDKHLLKSNYFAFEEISYHLTDMETGQVKLALHCRYSLESKMNGYANFWAESIIQDFEKRLLEALKIKIESPPLTEKKLTLSGKPY